MLPSVAREHAIRNADGDDIFVNGFETDVGVLLEGAPESLAINATVDMPPVPVPASDVENDLIMTRLDVWLSRSATVGQVNAALADIHGGIVTMTPGRVEITAGILRPVSHAALRQVQQLLNASPGILHASLGRMLPATHNAPKSTASADLTHLYASRFSAAWNTRHLATTGCETRKVEMRFIDYFGNRTLPPTPTFDQEVPGFTVLNPMSPDYEQLHGYEIVSVAAAKLDELNPTGANPFPQCLSITGVTIAGVTIGQAQKMALKNSPDGHFTLNMSLGASHPACEGGCSEEELEDYLNLPIDKAFQAIYWRSLSVGSEPDLLISTSAGNTNDQLIAGIYPFFAEAAFANSLSVAASSQMFNDTTELAYLRDHRLLDPLPQYNYLPSLYPSDEDVQSVRDYEVGAFTGLLGDPAANILVVGATTSQPQPSMVRESAFSNLHPTLHAVGEHVKGYSQDPNRQNWSGTSASAPQVAGLASYLWLVSADLRNRPLSDTISAIVENTQEIGDNVSLIDAYASVLSLDGASDTIVPTPQTMPIRLALLDLNDNGVFDDDDLAQFKAALVDNYVQNGEPQEQTWGRMDLNGDGYVGGGRPTRFDLDRRGSTQYGATQYKVAHQLTDHRTIPYDEKYITDLNVLCYYAYSTLFGGSAGERTRLLATACDSAYQPGMLDKGQDWEVLIGKGRTVFAGSTHGTDMPIGAWVRQYDLPTQQWSERKQLAPMRTVPPIQPDVYPHSMNIAVSNSGDAVAVWAGFTGGLWSSRYDKFTAQWGDAELTGPTLYSKPNVIMDNLGNAMAVGVTWDGVAYSINWTRYDKVSGHWSTPVPLPGTVTGYSPELAGTLDGTAYVASSTSAIYRYDRANGTWGAPEPIADTANRLAITVNEAGDVLALWKEPNAIFSRLRNHATGQWGAIRTLAAGLTPYDGGPSLAADAAGDALATWTVIDFSLPTSPRHLWASYYNAANDAWGSVLRLDESGNGVTDSRVAMNEAFGNARIVYVQCRADVVPYSCASVPSEFTRDFSPSAGWGPAELMLSGFQYHPEWFNITMTDDGGATINQGRSSYNESTGGAVEYVWMIRH